MTLKKILIVTLTLGFLNCNSTKKGNTTDSTYADVNAVDAMKNVMWNGELGAKIFLDTIANKKGLYGIGPLSYLKGEIVINNGNTYVSMVTSDSTMLVEKDFNASAPFFVYANVNQWKQVALPLTIKNINDLESFINKQTSENKRPFAFKLSGKIDKATIHIQNLPDGTRVSSPKEAHQGQTNYNLKDEEVDVIGFFSTEHQGIFTHHDSFVHLHLITKDEQKMGHLDALEIDNMTLYLPKL